MADLAGHLVAITCMCKTKLETLDEIGTWAKHNFQKEFLEMDLTF